VPFELADDRVAIDHIDLLFPLKKKSYI